MHAHKEKHSYEENGITEWGHSIMFHGKQKQSVFSILLKRIGQIKDEILEEEIKAIHKKYSITIAWNGK